MTTTLKDTNIAIAPDSGPVGANANLYDGWYDIIGGVYTIATGELTSGSNTNDYTDFLLLDSSLTTTVVNQQEIIEFIWPSLSDLDANCVLRFQSTGNCYVGLFFSGGVIFQKVVSGSVAPNLGTATFDQAMVTGHSYRVTWTINGTLWSIALRDLTTSTNYTWNSGSPTASVTDSTYTTAGRMGLSPRRCKSVTRLAAINLDGTVTTVTPDIASYQAAAILGGGQYTMTKFTGTGTTWLSTPTTPLAIVNSGGATAAFVRATVYSDTVCYVEWNRANTTGTATFQDQTGTGTAPITIAANTAINQVFNIGDSLTATVPTLAANEDMLGVSLALLGATWTGSKLGQGGRTIIPTSGNAIDFGSVPATKAGHNALIAEGGLNDMGIYGYTPAQVYAQLITYKDQFQALGWKFIIMTLGPYAGGISGLQTQVNTFNALLQNNWRADGFDELIDLANFSLFLNTADAPFNQYWYTNDQVHYGAPIYQVAWGPMQFEAILSAVNGGAGGGGSSSGSFAYAA